MDILQAQTPAEGGELSASMVCSLQTNTDVVLRLGVLSCSAIDESNVSYFGM